VDDLLDLSLIETQDVSTRAAAAVDEIVDEALERLRPVAVAPGSSSVSDVLPTVRSVCDRRQVVSAVANLLDNAIKYSEVGGAVEVSTVFDDVDW